MFNFILVIASFVCLIGSFILYLFDLSSSKSDSGRENKLPKLSSYGFFLCVFALMLLIIPSIGYVF
jgi:hypothetical protein